VTANPEPAPSRPTRSRAAWLTFLAVAAVAAVNGAGIHGIAGARQASRDEAARLFAQETASRAKAIERLVGETRANLAFLAASSTLARLGGHAGGAGLPAADREAAESLLLVFLRSHPEAVRLAVRSSRGDALLSMGRRGGVPVLWVSATPTGEEGAAVDPARPRLRTTVAVGNGNADAGPQKDQPPLLVQAEIAPALLLGLGDLPHRRCQLEDATGSPIARPTEAHGAAPVASLRSEARLEAEGWSAPSPWTLRCAEPETVAEALIDPVAARYRATLGLNLVAMACAALLGVLAVREAGRRERMEAKAEEAVRVRELERQLFHAERLTTVGRLAAGIAHEINNPLEGMANYLSLAEDAVAAGDGPATARRLQGVRQGLDRAAGIVRQVLAHADPAKAPKTPVDLNQLAAETVDFVRSRTEFAGIAFSTELHPGALRALGSPIMLGQVVSNLVINACEAQVPSGEVTVTSRKEGGRVVVEVADRGPGVAEADRERIFEPFFSTKDSTGLGLAVCHSIVREHGGSLRVHPRPGGGALFRMDLPAIEGGE
jgi:signal transduction histidine kinase